MLYWNGYENIVSHGAFTHDEQIVAVLRKPRMSKIVMFRRAQKQNRVKMIKISNYVGKIAYNCFFMIKSTL